MKRWAWIAAWLAAFVATRFALAPYVLPHGFHWDERLNACITPWKLVTGLPVKEDYYLADWLYVLSYRLFDFGVDQARLATIPFMAIGLAFYGLAFARMFGPLVAAGTMLLVLVTVQFVTLPPIPVYLCSGFWFSGPALYVLTLDKKRPLVFSLIFLASFLAYASGTLAIVSTLAMTLLLFHREWGWSKSLSIVFLCGLAMAAFMESRVAGDKRLGMTFVHFDLHRWIDGLLFYGREVFVSTSSWYSFAGENPYLAPELSALLLLAIALSLLLPPTKRRWAVVCVGSFLGSVALASLSNHIHGIRRIFPSTLLLVPVALLPLSILWEQQKKILAISAIAALLLTGVWRTHYTLTEWVYTSSTSGVKKMFPLRPRQDVTLSTKAASEDLAQRGYTDRVIFVGKGTEFDACAFYFTKANRGRFGTVEARSMTASSGKDYGHVRPHRYGKPDPVTDLIGPAPKPRTPDETTAIYLGVWH